MIIIIEGIDRVGKTTLCELIEEKYAETYRFRRFRDDTRYAHNYLSRQINTEKINTLQNLMEGGFVNNIILDRYHITEFVYGAVDRHYKNEDMYDIDRRLAYMSKKDTPDEDEEEIDPGMSFDGHIQNDVVLVYMVPVDIKQSSEEHGFNLERHLKWYDAFYDATEIKDKIKVDYTTMQLALDFIDDILGPYVPDEPCNPDVPVNPDDKESVVMELKTIGIDFEENVKTYKLPREVTGIELSVFINGLYMTSGVDYIIDDTVTPNNITFNGDYDSMDICTITYLVERKVDKNSEGVYV